MVRVRRAKSGGAKGVGSDKGKTEGIKIYI